jgi:hypothetical protein
MNTSPEFKFTWVPNNTVIESCDRPANEMDKKKGEIDAHSVEELASDFFNSTYFDKLKNILETADYAEGRKHRPAKYSQTPIQKKIAARLLMSALAFQRKVDFDHLIRIISTWDSRRPATINVVKTPGKEEYFISDGQHTVLAIIIMARLGRFPDVKKENWLDVEINCQVVETDDFSFAREHFLGINGEDKLPITKFDIHKIHVLGKRVDSPDNETQDKYEHRNNIQTALELFDIYPVHPDSPDRFKAGALIDSNLLFKIDAKDAAFFAENHKKYWEQEPVDAMEILPFQDLRKRLLLEGADLNSFEFKDFMRDINAIVKEVAGGWAEFKNLTQQVYPLWYNAVRDEETNAIPRDASLVLLLQLYALAGGSYNCVPKNLLKRYTENGKSMPNFLDSATKVLFK